MNLKSAIAICLFFFTSFVAGANTYYSQLSGDVTVLTNWNTIRLGGGTSPSNFTSGDIFVIQGTGNGGTSPHAMTTSGAWAVSGAGGTIQIENGATLTATFIIAVPNFQVDNGGLYIHNAVSGIANGVATDIPGSTTRVFGATSTVEIQKWANGGAAPVALPATTLPGWGNLIINVTALGGSWNQTGLITNIQGTLSIIATGGGTREFRFTGAATSTTAVAGGINISGGILTCVSGTASHTLNVTGDINMSGGTFTPSASSTSVSTVNVSGNFIMSGSAATTTSTSAAVIYNITGNLNMTGGTFSLSSSSSTNLTVNVNNINVSGASTTLGSSSSGSWTMTAIGDFNFSGNLFRAQNSSSAGHSYIFNLGGHFNMTGGTYTGGSSASGCELVLNFTGGIPSVNYIQSGGIITASRPTIYNIKSGKEVKLNNDINTLIAASTNGAVNVNSGGVLNLQTNNVLGAGTFTLSGGGTLRIGHILGIETTLAQGAVQTSGARGFNTGSSYEYNGLAAQITGTGLPSSIKSLTLNNSVFETITLTNSVNIDDSLSLQKGFLLTTSAIIINLRDTTTIGSPNGNFNTFGSVNNIGWERSFVKGPVRIDISSTADKWIPVGKIAGTDTLFAPVKLAKDNANPVADTVEYFATVYTDTAADAGTIKRVSNVEYWKINCNSTFLPDLKAKITLSWRPKSGVGDGVNNAQALDDLVIAHYLDAGSSPFLWYIEGGDLGIMPKGSGSTVNYGILSTIQSNSPYTDALTSPYFTLASKSFFNLLPLKLLSFSGYASARAINLNWKTAEERNVENFELQKSTDGNNFYPLTTTPAFNSVGVNNYSETDINPVSGINYYRLKIKDNTQKISYSPVVKIKFAGEALVINLYPNPVMDKLTINHDKAGNFSVVKIVSVSGVEVASQKIAIGQSQSLINTNNLQQGWYILKFINGNEIINKAFYKK